MIVGMILSNTIGRLLPTPNPTPVWNGLTEVDIHAASLNTIRTPALELWKVQLLGKKITTMVSGKKVELRDYKGKFYLWEWEQS